MISFIEKNNWIFWIITLVIAIGIFYVSSVEFSSGAGGPKNINAILYHLIAFFFFAFYLLISLTARKNKDLLILGIIISILYGISDEIHQLYVPGRYFAFGDILLDSVGILFASLIYTLIFQTKMVKLKRDNFLLRNCLLSLNM